MFDLDHFKTINDRYGHAIGDRVLQMFADIAKLHIGHGGFVGRWGGDEFVAILNGATSEKAASVAERIQAEFAISSADIDGRPVKATVSTGMVFSPYGPVEIPGLLVRADQALYRAKEDGRNRLSIAPAEAETAEAALKPAPLVPIGRRSAA
jgi:diguanylate cyclase (GGDEF)-like protein